MPVTITCAECGTDFTRPPSQAERAKYCSRECQGRAKSNRTEHTCEGCGEIFTTPASQGERVYCSRECQKKDNRTRVQCDNCGGTFTVREERAEGARFCDKNCEAEWRRENQGHGWSGDCSWCGGKVSRKPSSIPASGRVYCSTDCYYKDKERRVVGEDNPNFRPGYEPKYGESWGEVRARVIERDGGKCQYCGTERGKLDTDLHVHHIIPLRKFDSPEEANYMENLVSLCRTCHRLWEGIPVRPALYDTPH